jgi:lipopolysaccharide heptosyltransferase III
MNLQLAKYLDRYLGIFLCYLLAALHLFREMVAPVDGAIRVRRILMVKLWGFGNLVLLLPVFKMVRERYPHAEIHLLTLRRNRSILEGNPDIDRLWTIDDSGAGHLLATLLGSLAGLRRTKIDLFLDFEQFARTSALFGFLIGAPQRVGLKTPRQGRCLLYTAPVRYTEEQHMSRTFLDIALAAGVRGAAFVPLPVPFGEADSQLVLDLLTDCAGPLVAVHVGSGDNFIGRRWPAEKFAALADLLIERHGVTPVFTGTRAEVPLVLDVLSKMKWPHRARNVSGRLGLRALSALLDRALFLVSNDTGPVHLASGLGRPVLGLYGPNTPVLYGPLSEGSRSFYKGLPCSPCITNLNYKTSFCRLPVCIRNISVEEVYGQAVALLPTAGDAA